jgi:DNA-binding NtrC family response regulator
MARVLIVDDEAPIRQALRGILERQGYEVAEAPSARAAIARLGEKPPFEAALVDLRLPDEDGTVVLDAVRREGLPTAVVMISGHGSIPAAVAAVRSGAFDFLEKPLDRERVLITLRNASRQASLARQASEATEGGLITRSPLMQALLSEAGRLAISNAPVLVTGETGSGKEVLARWMHARSPASAGPFVAVNCAALPETLAESELFGHVKGAFTGADSARKGKFQSADGGTLFLDEVGDLGGPVQAKLLRVLEDGAVEPVGSDRSVPVKVRVIAATHRDLKAKAHDGSFREDLLFRIGGLPLEVPPLRRRPEDIPLLAARFLSEARARQAWPAAEPSQDFLKALTKYRWPGNVRELRWAVERAVLLAGPDLPGPQHLPSEVVASGGSPAPGGIEEARAGAESEAITRALDASKGNVSLAAKALGLSRSRLYEKMEELGLDPKGYRKK